MNEKKPETENTQGFYQTGDVHLPKSHRGILALLLIVIIFLGSLVTGLSLLNIRLLGKLRTQEQTADSVCFKAGSADTDEDPSLYTQVTFSSLGLTASDLTSFDMYYYGLPAGIYITDVHPQSQADRLGVCAGDILLQLGSTPVTNIAALQTQLQSHRSGETVSLVIYRSGSQYQLDIILE